MLRDITRAIIGIVAAVTFVSIAIHLMPDQTAPAPSAVQHTSVTVTVINQPPDYIGIAMCVLAVAVLLFVVVRFVLPAIREWRSQS